MEEFLKYNFKNKKCFLKKRYLLISEIGIGSYSTVYIAYDLKTKNYYAVKVFDNDSLHEGKLENKLYHKIDHPNIINVFDFFIIDITIHNILYKYYTLIFPLKNNNIKFINNKIFNLWTMNILHSIDYVHNTLKTCHTDIKPENFVSNHLSEDHVSIISDYDKYIYLFDNIKFYNIEKTHNHILEFIYLKEYYHTETDDEESESETESESSIESEYKMKDNKEIEKKINIKKNNQLILIDLGSTQHLNDLIIKKQYKLVQTRYYRSPEVILGLPYDEKIDIWSIGCTLFEIYTGEILFNPRSSDVYRTDHHHLYLISKVCGKIPLSMINKSFKKDKLFMKDYQIKYESLFPKFSLNIIKENIQNKKLLHLIYSCLEIDPKKRKSIKDLIEIMKA